MVGSNVEINCTITSVFIKQLNFSMLFNHIINEPTKEFIKFFHFIAKSLQSHYL